MIYDYRQEINNLRVEREEIADKVAAVHLDVGTAQLYRNDTFIMEEQLWTIDLNLIELGSMLSRDYPYRNPGDAEEWAKKTECWRQYTDR